MKDIPKKKGVINANIIKKDRILNSWVLIISGKFKGQKGYVTHVNNDIITLEISISAKKVFIQRSELRELNPEELNNQLEPAPTATGWDGGETQYKGGQTTYETGGKTPMAFNTPNYYGGGADEYTTRG